MKTGVLVVMSAFLMSAAAPVFALTPQEKVICAMSAGNCLDEEKNLEKQVVEIRNEINKVASISPDEMKKLENKLRNTLDRLGKIKDK